MTIPFCVLRYPLRPSGTSPALRGEIFRMRADNASVGDIANALKVDQRSVWRVLAAGPKGSASDQLDMFEV